MNAAMLILIFVLVLILARKLHGVMIVLMYQSASVYVVVTCVEGEFNYGQYDRCCQGCIRWPNERARVLCCSSCLTATFANG